MGIQKITFDGSNVTSKIDADLYHYLFSKDVGILKGLKQECTYTLANNTITFLDGYVSIFGRIVYIENQTTVSITPDSSKYGYVILAALGDNLNATNRLYFERFAYFAFFVALELTTFAFFSYFVYK